MQVLIVLGGLFLFAVTFDGCVASWRLDVSYNEVWESNQVRTMKGWEMISDENPYVIHGLVEWYVRTDDGQVYTANGSMDSEVRAELKKLRRAQRE